jgi:hypothetical protein
MKWKIALLTTVPLIAHAALPLGDTQGIVKSVRLGNPAAGAHTFEIWFESVQNNRWNCFPNPGYVRVRENGPTMTPEAFKQILAIALTAQASGKVLAVDSGTDPCNNGVTAYIVD